MSAVPLTFMHANTAHDERTAIVAQNLVKTYKSSSTTKLKQALKGIDLSVPKGCIFGLLGPNGAGKSTFINILGGTVVKTSGSVSVWGTDLDKDTSGPCEYRYCPTGAEYRCIFHAARTSSFHLRSLRCA